MNNTFEANFIIYHLIDDFRYLKRAPKITNYYHNLAISLSSKFITPSYQIYKATNKKNKLFLPHGYYLYKSFEKEKFVKEFLNTNHSVQLDITKNNNRINNEKNIKKSNNKKLKEENDTQIADLENNIISIDESTSQNIVNKNFSDLDDSELNEEIDNSRRKRRRSSATDD